MLSKINAALIFYAFCACAARRPISLRKEMGERTAKGSVLWNPLNRGGLRGLFAVGGRGAVICRLYRGAWCGSALCPHANRLVSLPPCCADGKRDSPAAFPRPVGATVPVARVAANAAFPVPVALCAT
jgi:hypothetical protein